MNFDQTKSLSGPDTVETHGYWHHDIDSLCPDVMMILLKKNPPIRSHQWEILSNERP